MPDQNNDNKPTDRQPTASNPPARHEKPPRVRVYGMIGQRLREFYDGVANEPVPDRFKDLLEKLEERGRTDQGGRD
jgi:Anti-sigma factor NepR